MKHPTQASHPQCHLEQALQQLCRSDSRFLMWLWPTTARRALWSCSLGPWRTSSVLASPPTLEKYHFTKSTLTGLVCTNTLHGAQLLGWHIVRGRSPHSVCYWWYSSCGWGAEHTPASSSPSALLPLPGVVSCWWMCTRNTRKSLAFFFLCFFLPFSSFGELWLITLSNLHSLTAMATISTCSS